MKYGIAANTYQTIDIKSLTEKQARTIYYEDWWQALEMDRFSPSNAVIRCSTQLSIMACITHPESSRELIGAKDDGIIGLNDLEAPLVSCQRMTYFFDSKWAFRLK